MAKFKKGDKVIVGPGRETLTGFVGKVVEVVWEKWEEPEVDHYVIEIKALKLLGSPTRYDVEENEIDTLESLSTKLVWQQRMTEGAKAELAALEESRVLALIEQIENGLIPASLVRDFMLHDYPTIDMRAEEDSSRSFADTGATPAKLYVSRDAILQLTDRTTQDKRLFTALIKAVSPR